MKVHLILKKKSYKQNLTRFHNFNGSKVVFVLLAKVIALYMRLIRIDVRQSGLESLVSGFFL